MKLFSCWTALAAVGLIAGLMGCSGDGGGDPTDPDEEGSVRATVTGDGDPLAGVTVRLFNDGGASAVASASTAANGQVTFADLTPGNYDVDVVVLAGFELAPGQTLRRDVVVEADEVATVTFALQEIVVSPTMGQVRARVVEGTTGVEDVEVSIFTSGGVTPIETLTTGADGRVLFDSLAAGGYDVGIELPDEAEVAAGDTTRKAVTVVVGATTDVQFAIDLPDPVIIEASGVTFSPSDVTVAPGTRVRWIKGTNPHTVTPNGHAEWTAASLDQPNETFDHTFNTVGNFPYVCEIHFGMTGIIRVQN